MKEHQGDFDADLFTNLLTGKELAHLLLSDIQALSLKIQQEFPDVVKLGSIGQTWEGREITYLEVDARQFLINKGVKPASAENPIKVQMAEKKKDDSELVASEIADGDDLPHESDGEKKEKQEKQKKNDEFNRVPSDVMNDALGAELVQLGGQA